MGRRSTSGRTPTGVFGLVRPRATPGRKHTKPHRRLGHGIAQGHARSKSHRRFWPDMARGQIRSKSESQLGLARPRATPDQRKPEHASKRQPTPRRPDPQGKNAGMDAQRQQVPRSWPERTCRQNKMPGPRQRADGQQRGSNHYLQPASATVQQNIPNPKEIAANNPHNHAPTCPMREKNSALASNETQPDHACPHATHNNNLVNP